MKHKPLREADYWDNTYRQTKIRDTSLDIFPACIDDYRFTTRYFFSILARIRNKRVLSIGGGVDRYALFLAQNNNEVISIDVSPEAGRKTLQLAKEYGLGKKVRVITGSCEDMSFYSRFDVVVSRHALHHMNFVRALTAIECALAPGGSFLAEEPICLTGFVRFFHNRVPFHPEPLCFTEDEFEFSSKELNQISAMFRNVSFYYADFIMRESIMYVMYKAGLKKLLPCFGRLDAVMLKRLSFLRKFCSYVIVNGTKA
jgi:2-polyprenyl-3-methyl-5-hydroxy-6-metoxy-1,4-benzoquinol methylase